MQDGKRPGGRTRPLRCFAIRGLSSDSLALRDVEVIRSSIASLVSMAMLAWVHDFRLLGLHNIFCRMAGVLAESRIWCKKVAHLQSSVFKLSKDLIDSIHEEGIVAYTS